MAEYVDIHVHLLPGIDDGPPDMEGSLELARAAAQVGTTTIAATPHLRADFPDVRVDELADRCQEVRQAIAREAIPLRVLSGAEVSLGWALDATQDELRQASYGGRGTDLLIETPSTIVVGLDRILYDLRAAGFRITLAHPERSQQFARNPSALESLVEQGVLLQLNAGSLMGPAGRSGPRRLARTLCRQGRASALASDGHRGERWRPVTELPEAAGAVARLVGEARAQWMMAAVPGAIIEGAPLPEVPTAELQGGWLSRLFCA